MRRTMTNRAGGLIQFIGMSATALALTLGLLLAAAVAQDATPRFYLTEHEVPPWAGFGLLLRTEAVPRELKLTEAQNRDLEAKLAPIIQEFEKKRRAARRDTKDRKTLEKVQAAYSADYRAVIQQVLSPQQWERLDQIQLRMQGPLAFDRRDEGPFTATMYTGPPLTERLKLSDEQVKQIKAIVAGAEEEIRKAASFPIPLKAKDNPTTTDIERYVASAEFQAAKKSARQAGWDAAAGFVRRIEEVLSEPQRQAYHQALGEPFRPSHLSWPRPADEQRKMDGNSVSRFLAERSSGGSQRGGGGQRSDPDFNARVVRPAYASSATHPRILFDEAHHNFHTADGRYKPFADLMANDGYQIIRNRDSFTRDVLQRGDILIIANALGSERMGAEEAGNSAFTDAECDAVRDWVREGGSLLLITDHAPMGAAAERLAGRFGVGVSKESVRDPRHSEAGHPAALYFSRQDGLLCDHPITNGRDPSERLTKVQTFTGTSLKGPTGSAPILKLADTAVERSPDKGGQVSAAGRSQGLAFPFGKGRVVVMGEAAGLSAQLMGSNRKAGMNVPGIDNRQLALNILHWLSGLLEPRDGALRKAG